MITAQVENYRQAIAELAVLYPDHWEELALDKDHPEAALDPLWEVYAQRDAEGQLLLVTLREIGELVGYFIGFIGPGLHYRKCLTCQGDIFRVLPKVRGRMGGKRLMRAVLDECKRRGVRRVFLGEKLHSPCAKLFAAFGAKPVEQYHSLWIEE